MFNLIIVTDLLVWHNNCQIMRKASGSVHMSVCDMFKVDHILVTLRVQGINATMCWKMTRKITFLKAESTIEMCPKDTPTVMQLNVGGFNTYCRLWIWWISNVLWENHFIVQLGLRRLSFFVKQHNDCRVCSLRSALAGYSKISQKNWAQ